MGALVYMRGAAAAVCLVVSAGSFAQEREPLTAAVGYADLNLATPAGRAALKRRIHHVASQSCVSKATGLEAVADRSRCMREMENDGDSRLAMLIAAPPAQLATAAVGGR